MRTLSRRYHLTAKRAETGLFRARSVTIDSFHSLFLILCSYIYRDYEKKNTIPTDIKFILTNNYFMIFMILKFNVPIECK